MMSMWWQNHSVTLALSVATGVRVVQSKAASLASPPTLRRVRAQALRLVTVVAGH